MILKIRCVNDVTAAVALVFHRVVVALIFWDILETGGRPGVIIHGDFFHVCRAFLTGSFFIIPRDIGELSFWRVLLNKYALRNFISVIWSMLCWVPLTKASCLP